MTCMVYIGNDRIYPYLLHISMYALLVQEKKMPQDKGHWINEEAGQETNRGLA